jgi:hypothetical protein
MVIEHLSIYLAEWQRVQPYMTFRSRVR